MDDTKRAKLSLAWRAFVVRSVALLPLLVIVRVGEIFAAARAHPMPNHALWFAVLGVLSDAMFALVVAAVLALPILALSLASERLAAVVHIALLTIVVIAAVALAQYFATTFVPLGADLFGYSLGDIRATVGASTGVGIGKIAAFALAAVGTPLALWRVGRMHAPHGLRIGFATALPVVLLASPSLAPRASAFSSDAAYFVTEDKTLYFAQETLAHFAQRSTSLAAGPMRQYPFLHAGNDADVLGPLLTRTTQRPNIVILVVEGLGRDFVGPSARFGGFTPRLDSLAARSLFWSDALSSTGRTFGALPAILASLPPADGGFMSLGAKMPRHESLVSLLKENGYTTNYFAGFAGHFDNTDVFLEREGIDRFVDETQFGSTYTKEPASDAGFSWGYADADLFRRSLEILGDGGRTPRLDVYQTITSHEPFIPPNADKWRAAADARAAQLGLSGARLDDYHTSRDVFATLMYVDDAIAGFLRAYATRPEFARTLFVITGDHRLIPIPDVTRIDRFRVPLIVYSPMIRAPRSFPAVVTHLDITPTLLAWLTHDYALRAPDSASWLGTSFDTSSAFRATRTLGLMRTIDAQEDFIDSTHFLSRGDSYELGDQLAISPSSNGAVHDRTQARMTQFFATSRYAVSGDHVFPGGAMPVIDTVLVAREDSAYHAAGLDKATPEQAYAAARDRTFARQYVAARLILGRMLRDAPNYHDARVLLAETYAFDEEYDSARAILAQVEKRAPGYLDARVAAVNVELFAGRGAAALQLATAALEAHPGNGDLLVGKARALEELGRKAEALATLDLIRPGDPALASAAPVRARLTR